jgi:hypothetical protein
MLGKFKFSDWDPIKEDNIMVTGHLGVAMGLYESATGDYRYREKDCLDMVISDGKHYKTNYEGVAETPTAYTPASQIGPTHFASQYYTVISEALTNIAC